MVSHHHAAHTNDERTVQHRHDREPCLSSREDENSAAEYSESSLICHDDTPSKNVHYRDDMEVPSSTTNSMDIIPLSCHYLPITSSSISERTKSKRFVTNMALLSTICSVVIFFVLTVSFSEWSMNDVLGTSSALPSLGIQYNHTGKERKLFPIENPWEEDEFTNHDRQLEQDNDNNNNNDAESVDDGDYSSYRCVDIFINTPSPSDYDNDNDKDSPTERCQYAQTCEGTGLLLPFIFCSSRLSPTQYLLLISPLLLLILTLLFRLLGSTAEEYFSPSLEMFSFKLGLPPRFAGVSLLALGNGAADVSATMNAIASDPVNGYKMSLGALTGAAMFITTVVAGSVILANGGIDCRGALVRDVAALGVTVVVVALNLEKGVVGKGTERLFISIYVGFVIMVLIADVYHRAVMVPRIRKETELIENQRQLEAERLASSRAGDALNAFAETGASVTSEGGGGLDAGLLALDSRIGSSASDGFPNVGMGGQDGLGDDRTHVSAPGQMEDTAPKATKNRALNAVLTALSNYNDDEHDLSDEDAYSAATMGRNRNHRNRPNDGWGVESTIEGSREWDRPVVLRGADGILTRHPHHHSQTSDDNINNEDQFDSSPYHVMEDMELLDGLCIEEGSVGFSAHNWRGAWHDGKQELMVHFREYWRDIWEDDESGKLEKFLLVCEFPMTVARKLTVSIPCEGSYCRALVALSFALSPLWLGVYIYSNFDVNLWGWKMGIFVALAFGVGLMIMRYAPGGDGTMVTMLAVPIALYGFLVAATWIDWIAGNLVTILEFLGIILRIPNYIMGLTVLAWGNSMADLSANVTMARKGLANMAITACFAGPLFNILVGLGAGFGVMRSVTKTDVNYVELTPSITTGFVFCFINCGLLLVSGLAINKGVIPAGYGYAALVIYIIYIATSLLLQFLL